MDHATSEQLIVLSASESDHRRRDELIREFYGRICMRLDLAPVEKNDFDLDASTIVLPGMSATRGAVSPMTWRRTGALMEDGNDDVVISWIAGGFRFERQGRNSVQTGAGAACIMPMDQAWRAETPDGAWTVCIQLPKASLAAFVRDIEDVPPDAINPDTPEGGLLLDYLSAVTRRPPSPALAPMVSRHIMDLLAVSIGCSPEIGWIAGRRGICAARLRAIKQYVCENLSQPLLSAETAGRHFKLSPRYIRRLFATEDRSFSDYLAEQRLAWVYRQLCDPRSSGKPIADIAFEAGLAEPSTFYRRFKARYGITPSDLRACPFTCAKQQR